MPQTVRTLVFAWAQGLGRKRETSLAGGDFGERIVALCGSEWFCGIRSADFVVQMARIEPSDGNAGDDFGRSVAATSAQAVVGAPMARVESQAQTGAAYVFRLSAQGVEQRDKLTPEEDEEGTGFGTAVAASETDVLIGAPKSRNETGSAQLVSDTEEIFVSDFEG